MSKCKDVRIVDFNNDFNGWAVDVFMTDDLKEEATVVAYIEKGSDKVLWQHEDFKKDQKVVNEINGFIKVKAKSELSNKIPRWKIYIGAFILMFVLIIYFGEQTDINSKSSASNELVVEPVVLKSENVVNIKLDESELHAPAEFVPESQKSEAYMALSSPRNACKAAVFDGYHVSQWKYMNGLGWSCGSDLQYNNEDGSINEVVFYIESGSNKASTKDVVKRVTMQASIFDTDFKEKVKSEFINKISLFYSRLGLEVNGKLLENIINETKVTILDDYGRTTFIVEDDYMVGYGLLITVELKTAIDKKPKQDGLKSVSESNKTEINKALPSPQNVSIDKNAILLDATTKQIEALVTIVRAYGYSCDSVITVAPFSFSEGFTLKCNGYRYVYDIENKGGNWVVKVK